MLPSLLYRRGFPGEYPLAQQVSHHALPFSKLEVWLARFVLFSGRTLHSTYQKDRPMSVINQIKRMAGQGAQLKIKPPHTYFTPGTPISFEVAITATQSITIRRVLGELVSHLARADISDEDTTPAHLQFEIAGELMLDEGEEVHLTASIRLPEDTRPTASAADQPLHWTLRVTLDIPAGLDVVESTPVIVAPAITAPWTTPERLRAKNEKGGRLVWQAAGTFVCACPEGTDPALLTALIKETLVEALADYLAAEPDLAARFETEDEEALLKEVAGALREIAVPRVREAQALSLDNIATVTIDRLIWVRER